MFRILAALIFGVSLMATPLMADEAANLENAKGILDMIYNQRKTKEAFEKYIGDEYIQHNPSVPTGVQGSLKALEKLIVSIPKTHYYFIRGSATGDLVFLHCHRIDYPGDRGLAVVDIFRFDKNGKIVEHWDVVQKVPAEAANNNTMF